MKKKYENTSEVEKLKQLSGIFNNPDRFDINGTDTQFYLISTRWVKDFLNFYKALTHSERGMDKLFERNRVLLHYFGDGDEQEGIAVYPGPINNFELVNFKSQILDSEEPHTNIILKDGIKENSDFLYVSAEEWKLLKDSFGCNFEILRLKETLHEEIMIEVNLRRFKVLVLGSKIQKNDMFPKNVQISKSKTVGDLRKKMTRCLDSKVSDGVKFYLFPFGLKDRRNELFQIVYSYTNGTKKMKTKATLITDDSCNIAVNF
jgi:hypothetical protein